MPSSVTAICTAIAEGCKLAWAIFTARNAPAMQANAKAATIQKIKDSVNQHIQSGNLDAVRKDGS